MSEEQSALEQPVTASTESAGSSLEPRGLSDMLPEDLRSEASLQSFKDVGALAKSYVHSQRMLGNSIRIPSEDTNPEAKQEFYERLSKVDGVMLKPNPEDPESMNKFFNSLGRPESPDKYDLKIPDDVAPFLDQRKVEEYKQLAHRMGMTNEQANVYAQYEVQKLNEYTQRLQQGKEQSSKILRDQWGPDYENRMQGAKAAMEVYREKYPDAVNQLLGSEAGNNPALIAMLSELGQLHQESGHVGASRAVQYGMSSDEARDKIAEIMGNPSHPYFHDGDPNHQDAVARMKKLYSVAYSG